MLTAVLEDFRFAQALLAEAQQESVNGPQADHLLLRGLCALGSTLTTLTSDGTILAEFHRDREAFIDLYLYKPMLCRVFLGEITAKDSIDRTVAALRKAGWAWEPPALEQQLARITTPMRNLLSDYAERGGPGPRIVDVPPLAQRLIVLRRRTNDLAQDFADSLAAGRATQEQRSQLWAYFNQTIAAVSMIGTFIGLLVDIPALVGPTDLVCVDVIERTIQQGDACKALLVQVDDLARNNSSRENSQRDGVIVEPSGDLEPDTSGPDAPAADVDRYIPGSRTAQRQGRTGRVAEQHIGGKKGLDRPTTRGSGRGQPGRSGN